MIKKLKDYLEDKEIEELEIEEAELNSIKSNYLKLAKYFIEFYLKFSKDLKDSSDSKIIIDENKKHFNVLNELVFELNNGISFGNDHFSERIKRYVKENYQDLSDFIDLCVEVYSE